MITKAQQQASSRYRSKSVKQINVAFYPKEQVLYEYVCLHENKAGYIKELISKDMEENGGNAVSGTV